MMMGKLDLLAACRRLASQVYPVDDFLSVKLCHQLVAYEANDKLGGDECARVAKTLRDIRLAMEPRGIHLAQIGGLWLSEWGDTYTLESQAWEAFFF